MDWTRLVGELRNAEYFRGVVTTDTQPFRVAFDAGLTDIEVANIEERHGFRFPPDLRAFLQTALPCGDGFPDWRGGEATALVSWMDESKEGVLFDVEHSSFWLEDWGARPRSLARAKETAARMLTAAPRLIPIFAHRMIPAEPAQAGNPVLSVHQTDVICYGFDLEDYLRHEFKLSGRHPWPQQVRPIRFWSKLL